MKNILYTKDYQKKDCTRAHALVIFFRIIFTIQINRIYQLLLICSANQEELST